MATQTAQKYLEELRTGLRVKLESGRLPRLSEKEYRDLQERVTARNCHEAAQWDTPFDPGSIGLQPGDMGLDWSDIIPGISDAAKAVAVVRPALERGHGMIFLWGSYGQAKTLIGKILVARAYAAGKRAAYANFLEALDNIRQAFDEQEHKTTELIRRIDRWTGRDVLFLDEFDKCNDTPWAVERKFQIVDRCYQRAIREESLTVIASNRGDDEVDGYIRSRLRDSRLGPVVHLAGADGREVMPKNWRY